MEIVPAILPYTFKELEEGLEKVAGATRFVQIDITDGVFAGIASWPLAKPDRNFEEILRQERGMPFWEEFDFEFDLMVKDPFALAQDLISCGASRIIFHAESIDLDEDKMLLDKIKSDGVVEVGIAIRSTTPPELLKELLEFADFFQVMTCNPIGQQGSAFDEKALEIIKLIRSWVPNAVIACDGAMNPETIELVYNAGASRFAVGSYILKSDNPRLALESLEQMD